MNAKRESPRLGRGLAALLGDAAVQAPPEGASVRQIPLDLLEPNPFQPRTVIEPAALKELTQSVRTHGILQPLLVRPHPTIPNRYQIVAGERRWRAAQRAGLHEVPVVIVEVSDGEALQLAIVENVQRADLNPLEEAEGYRALIRDFSHSQDDVAKMVGKSRSHVANTLRLQTLPDRVREHIHSGRLSAGHARALVGHHDAERLADEIVTRGLNVRQVETIAREAAKRTSKQQTNDRNAKQRTGKGADTLALEKRLADALGLSVRIDHRSRGGTLAIHYRSLDQLDDVVRRLEDKR